MAATQHTDSLDWSVKTVSYNWEWFYPLQLVLVICVINCDVSSMIS